MFNLQPQENKNRFRYKIIIQGLIYCKIHQLNSLDRQHKIRSLSLYFQVDSITRVIFGSKRCLLLSTSRGSKGKCDYDIEISLIDFYGEAICNLQCIIGAASLIICNCIASFCILSDAVVDEIPEWTYVPLVEKQNTLRLIINILLFLFTENQKLL